MFLEWKSQDWLKKVEARGNTTPDIGSGLNAYARKQAAIHHNLAVSFTKLWRPTLVSYNLKHSWVTEFLAKNGVPLTGADDPTAKKRGIFRFRLSGKSRGAASAATSPSTTLSPAPTSSFSTPSPITTTLPPTTASQLTATATLDQCPILEEYDSGMDTEESDTEGSDSDFEDYLEDDSDF